MAAISVKSVQILNNKGKFTDPFEFEVSCECSKAPLKDDMEWKLLYVGSAENDKCDQILETVFVGPVGFGLNQFIFHSPAPDATLIPPDDLLGVTVVLLIGSYIGQEFVRIGYYVNNEYNTQELRDNPPTNPPIENLDKIERSILAEKPRITVFAIDWDKDPTTEQSNSQTISQQQQQILNSQQTNSLESMLPMEITTVGVAPPIVTSVSTNFAPHP